MGALGYGIRLTWSNMTYARSRSIDVVIFAIRILCVISIIVILGGVLWLLFLDANIPVGGTLNSVVILLLELAIWSENGRSTLSTSVHPDAQVHALSVGHTSSISTVTLI